MAVLLGLLSAVAFGAADFLGGVASKRAATLTVVLGQQAVGLLLSSLLAPLVGADDLTTRKLVYAAVAGLVGVTGVGLLFRGLAVGRMSVIAPITAVGAAVLPVAWGLVSGERPSGVALAGVALAVPAVVLIARVPHDHEAGPHDPRFELLLAAGAGLCFGVALSLFGESADGTGMWPLVVARVAAVSVLGTAALATGRFAVPDRGVRPTVVGCGVLDVTGNGCYVAAASTGLVSLVAVLSSLYPAGTVLLARVVLGERLTRHQVGGIVLAVAGAALIAAG